MKRQDVTTSDIDAIIKDGRARQAKRRRKSEPAKPKKVTFEIDPVIADLLEQVAGAVGVSKSGTVNRFLLDALQRYADGALDFDGYLAPSRGPRFRWIVRVDAGNLPRDVAKRIVDDNGGN